MIESAASGALGAKGGLPPSLMVEFLRKLGIEIRVLESLVFLSLRLQ